MGAWTSARLIGTQFLQDLRQLLHPKGLRQDRCIKQTSGFSRIHSQTQTKRAWFGPLAALLPDLRPARLQIERARLLQCIASRVAMATTLQQDPPDILQPALQVPAHLPRPAHAIRQSSYPKVVHPDDVREGHFLRRHLSDRYIERADDTIRRKRKPSGSSKV